MQRPPTRRFFAYALIVTLVGSLFSVVLPAFQPTYASHENITVNVSGDPVTEIYSPGDSVAVEGVIDEVVEDEDVTIRFKEPDGSTDETDNFGEPSSSGNFDAVNETPNNAPGGIWTVEVDYDTEKAYTYFMMEYDEDDVVIITTVLDANDHIYQAGDEVTISGAVDDVVDGEEFVEIIVLDPANQEIVEEDEVELDDDEFEFTFDLDSDAAHGRYAVLVTYDNEDQEGAIIFEIEDEDAGSNDDDDDDTGNAVTSDTDGDLSAEIPEELYEQGQTVIITGEIDGYDEADDEDLGISIRDPDDLEIAEDDSVSVEDNGDFEFEYDIADDADEGDYSITITYNNDEVELVFEVEESSGNGSGDGGGSGSSDDLTVNLNKASYLAGESMTVSGTVDSLEEDDDGNPEQVSIFLYRPNGQVVLDTGSFKYVEPSSDRAYSATILLDSDLEEDDDYYVTVGYADFDEAQAFFDITGVTDNPSDEIAVETDAEEYSIGQTVEISGEVPSALIVSGQQLLIRVNTPNGDPCRLDPITVPSGGSYTYDLVLGGKCGIVGEYEVIVTYGDNEAETAFTLIGSSTAEYDLSIEGDTYPIEYELSGGSIDSMFARATDKKLIVNINTDEEGELTLVLPREVIDAVEDGEDIDFIVTIEDDSGNITVVEVDESENTDDERTLVIPYAAGAERIEIQGTQVVPEFGAMAAIIMAMAVVGMIIATAKFGNKFSLFRQ